MHQFRTILNQLLHFLTQPEFAKAFSKLKTDRYVKYFNTKALFVVHLYDQIRKKIVYAILSVD